MKESINPLFSDVTWGAGGSTADLTMDIAEQLRKTGHVANMHMTCTNLEKDGDPKAAVHSALVTAKITASITSWRYVVIQPPGRKNGRRLMA